MPPACAAEEDADYVQDEQGECDPKKDMHRKAQAEDYGYDDEQKYQQKHGIISSSGNSHPYC
jgi:hypothetical protein